MSLASIDLLDEVIEDIAADDSVRAFVLTAERTHNFSVRQLTGTRVGWPLRLYPEFWVA
jgi:hypothetical protein